MKKIIIVSCLLLVVSFSAGAMQPEIIGGVRDGMAIGMMADAPVAKNVGIRFGLEGNTGRQPLLLFFGGKFLLTYLGRSPMYFGLGAVGYTGGSGSTSVGPALSVVFNRAFNVNPMFVEFGGDVADGARLLAQVGYKIY
ncbi:MAG: hypothetical protein KJ732_02605 [Candidatus Margulisbacteria bacterium]|nr:hypothetical protein [Candidatus Margulisiibacteriota bacterium]